MPVHFLKNPSEIRKAVLSLQGGGRVLKMAVAFVGRDWQQMLSRHDGAIKLICWLSSTNTHPYAVEQLINESPRTEVRQRKLLHSKVYVVPNSGAIVGSANLTTAALAESDTAGQSEAGILVTEAGIVRAIDRWFDALWADKGTLSIGPADLSAAQRAFDLKSKGRAKGVRGRRSRTDRLPGVTKRLGRELFRYAGRVRNMDLRARVGHEWLASLDPRHISASDHNEILRNIVGWTGHPGSYGGFKALRASKVRRGMQLLFDSSLDVTERLEKIEEDKLLGNLKIPSISLLLYWRDPASFPPFNKRTREFLHDFKMKKRGMSNHSAANYSIWLSFATDLAQRVGLPSAGYVDRMVEEYWEDKYKR